MCKDICFNSMHRRRRALSAELRAFLYVSSFLLCSVLCHSQSLKGPNAVVIPDCPIGVSTSGYTCYTVFALRNTGSEGIDLLNLSIESSYPWEIVTRGNYLSLWGQVNQFFSAPIYVSPKDSAVFSLRFHSRFVDSISATGPLRSTLRFTYSLSGDTVQLVDSLQILVRATEAPIDLRSSGWSSEEIRACDTYDFNDSNTVSLLERISLYNTTENERVIIDSMKILSATSTYRYLGVALANEPNDIASQLPYTLLPDQMCVLVFRNGLSAPIHSKEIVSVYAHSIDSKKSWILKDSLRTYRRSLPTAYSIVEFGSANGKIGDTARIVTNLLTSQCSGDSIRVDSVSVVPWSSAELSVLAPEGLAYPIQLDRSFIYKLPVVFRPLHVGRTRGFIKLHLSQKDSSFERHVRFTTFTKNGTTGVDECILAKDGIAIRPQPTNSLVYIDTKQPVRDLTIIVQDVVGRQVLYVEHVDLPYIVGLEGMAAGMYMIRVISTGKNVWSSICVVEH